MPRAAPYAFILLAGGCSHPHVEPGPVGLAYLCGGEPLTVVYNDGGYLPGSAVREGQAAAARSRAVLTFRGNRLDLVADDALTDLRYVGRIGLTDFVWTAEAESAQVEWLGPDAENRGRLECRRVRTVTPVAPATASVPRPAA